MADAALREVERLFFYFGVQMIRCAPTTPLNILGVVEQGPRKTKACLSPSLLTSSHTTALWTIRTTGVIVFEPEAARNDTAPLPSPVIWGRQVTVDGHKSG